MTLREIRAVIQKRFMTLVGTEHPITAVFDNDTEDAEPTDAGERWVRVQVRPGQNDQVSIGSTSKRFRMRGIVQVVVYGPLHEGTYELEEIAEKVIDAFRSVRDSGVVFFTPSQFSAGRGEKSWEIAISCPWEADHLAA